MTPAQAHKQQVLAEQAAQNGEDINAAEPYRRLLASLNADRSVLSQIKAVADKVLTAVYESFFRTPISTQFNNR